jgi:hypothetical protein
MGFMDDMFKSIFNPQTLPSIIGNVAGGMIGSWGANSARQAQGQATGQANQLLQTNLASNQAQLDPWKQAGTDALGRLNSLLGVSGKPDTSAVSSMPGYQFGLDEGLKGVERSAASRTGTLSGAATKAIDRYSQDYASTKFNDYTDRLMNLAGMGQGAAGSMAGYGANAGNQQAANLTNMGNAAAGANIANANQWNNSLQGIIRTISNKQLIDQIRGKNDEENTLKPKSGGFHL